MRECLGWLTNCPDEKRCPQNWLELAYTELPATVECHVCGQTVQLVKEEAEFDNLAQSSGVTAFPIVPCAGGPASYGALAGQSHVARPSGIVAAATGAEARPMSRRQNGEAAAPPPARPRPPPPKPKALFAVLSSGDTVKVEKDNTIIGRSRTCDVVIPSAKVSRQHASITRDGGKYIIEDLGSANGIWRDGEKVNRVEIMDGDVFTISEETITFEMRSG